MHDISTQYSFGDITLCNINIEHVPKKMRYYVHFVEMRRGLCVVVNLEPAFHWPVALSHMYGVKLGSIHMYTLTARVKRETSKAARSERTETESANCGLIVWKEETEK